MAGVSRIKEIADINQPNKLLIEMIEKLPSFQNNPFQDGVLAPNAITFQVVLAQDPLAAQGAPRSRGWRLSRSGEEVFRASARGRRVGQAEPSRSLT